MKKRILVLLLALVMVAGFALPAAAAQDELVSDEPVVIAEDPAPASDEAEVEADVSLTAVALSDGDAPTTQLVSYVDEDGKSYTATATKVTGSTTDVTWAGGTEDNPTCYYVDADTTINGKVTVTGSVNLILCDGMTLTVSSGLSVGTGSEQDGRLTIYGQSGKTGKLVADGGTGNYAGIDVSYSSSLTVNGGNIEATGGSVTNYNGSTGISLFYGSVMTVNGGRVTATGARCYAQSLGIHIQRSGDACSLTVNGGEVMAIGNETTTESWGIYNSGAVTINGGKVIGESKASGGKAICNGVSIGASFDLPSACYWRSADNANYKTRSAYTDSALAEKYFELTTTKPASNIEPYVTGAAANVTYGDEPDGSVITATTDVEGTFVWKSDVTGYGDASTTARTFTATFTPNDSSYVPVDVEVSVTVNKKTLTVTAKDHSITYGDEAVNDGVTYDGFVTGEDASKLSGTLVYDYTYSQYDNAGSYTITPKGLASDNYDITFKPGALTVEPKTIGIDWSDTKLTHNGKPQKPMATATGLVNGDECTITVTGEQTEAGTYTATATGLDNPNYKLPENVTCEFTIAAKPAEAKKEPPKAEKAPQTGDAGIALYVISAASSMTGLAWLGRKKKR